MLVSSIILPSYASAVTVDSQPQSSISDIDNDNVIKDSSDVSIEDTKDIDGNSDKGNDTADNHEEIGTTTSKSLFSKEETEGTTNQMSPGKDNLNSSSDEENNSSSSIDTLDTVVTPEVSVKNLSPSSADTPLKQGDSVVYKLTLTNRDTKGNVVPAGTKIKFTITPVAGVSASNFLTYLSYSTENMRDFTVESTTNGAILTIENDFYPGTQEVNVNFLVKNPGYNWDGLDNKTDPAVASGNMEISLVEIDETTTIISSDQIYVKPSKYSPPVNPGTAGWTASGTGGVLGVNNSNYPDDQAAVRSGSVYLQNPYNRSVNGSMFFSYLGNFQPVLSANPHTGGLYFKSDLPFDTSANTLYYNGVNISNAPGVVWNVSEDKLTIEVIFSDYMQANGIVNGNFFARVYVPAADINSINVVQTAVRSYGNNGIATQGAWNYTTMFQSVTTGTSIPYFRGNDKTIYTTDNYDPLQDIYAYSAQTNITNAIKITNYDGYPTDGKQPTAGIYTIHYSVTNTSGETSEFTRKITVLENKQSISGSDFNMYVGDKTPTVSDFKATATDKDGKELEVTADFSKVDFSKAGTYEVTLQTTDGQTKTVKLVIKENKQSINGADFSMYVGDKTPTVSDFKATATDKDGKELEVTADFSKVDFSKAGTYEVTLQTTDGQTKTVKLVIKEKNKAINQNIDKNNHLSRQSKQANNFKANLPSTGEQKSNLFYVIGTILILLALAIFGGLKKYRRRN